MKRSNSYFCAECGHESAKWQGRCPGCGAWNSFTEAPVDTVSKVKAKPQTEVNAVSIGAISVADEIRIPTGLSELDRVLGGGAVAGSIILISGEPGIGKSTLLMQICRDLARFANVLYVSGEESPRQLKLRGERLGVGYSKIPDEMPERRIEHSNRRRLVQSVGNHRETLNNNKTRIRVISVSFLFIPFFRKF